MDAKRLKPSNLTQIKACGFLLQSSLVPQAGKLEEVMTTPKTLILVTALFAGGTSLVLAQNATRTGEQLPVAGGAAGSPTVSGPASGTTRTARHHGTRHHRMYMMAVNRTHKGSKLTPDNNAKPLSEWLHRP